MKLTYNNSRKRFEAESDYSEKEALKSAGFSWDGVTRRWHSDHWKEPGKHSYGKQCGMAAKFVQFADKDATARISDSGALAAVELERTSLEQSRAAQADVNIVSPAGLDYLPYQKAGIDYAMRRPNTLIADEMGLGKTIQAIGISNTDPTARRILIVCPASLKLNWKREWEKWDVKKLSVEISRKDLPDTDVVITNYEVLKKFATKLRATNWDLLIVDECHYIKESRAQRTEYLLGRKETKRKNKETGQMEPVPAIAPIGARRRVFLTGTPIVNRPKELWPIVESLDPDGLGESFFKFAKRYCNAHQNRYGWDFSGASNLPELQEKLRSKFMVRRLKADVLKELPPKRRQVIVLDWSHLDKKAREEMSLALELEKKAYANMESADMKTAAIAFTEMAAARKRTAVAKIPLVIEYLQDTLEEVEKLVVMVHHHEVVDALASTFGNAAVTVDGRTSIEDRQMAVDRFQQDVTCKLFIGTIKAAGVGLTLTASSTVVFGELDWVPGNVTQAEDRCHRIGQVNTVLVKHLVLDESLDANMVEKIVSKQNVIDSALDKVHEKPKPVAAQAPAPTTPKTPSALSKTQPELTPEEIAAVHQCLRILAGVCDGAIAQDGRGFNGRDTDFGKSLAAQGYLTPRQALAGQKMLRTYHRQLPENLLAAAGIKKRAA